MTKYLPIILSIILFILVYFIRLQQGGWEPEFNLFTGLRDSLDKRIQAYLPSPQAELLSGILLGQNGQLPPQFKLALRDTSTLHIVVASGQNLSMLAGFFLLLSGLIKRQLAITLSFLAVVLYVLLTGVQVPVLRAAIMVSLAFFGQLVGRERDAIWILIVTGGVMLLVNPTWLTSISFQLSFLATLGVVVVSPLILKQFKHLPEFISQDLAVSLAAQLMVLPVIAQNFHQLSLVALPTNLLILWTIPLIMIGGAVLLILSLILPPLAMVMAYLLNAMLSYFIIIVNFFAGFNWAWVYVGEMSWLFWVGYYLLLVSLLKFIYDRPNIQD
jgi:competence protein ComEC